MKEGMNDTDYFNRNNSAHKGKPRPEGMRRKALNSSGKSSAVENKLQALDSSLVSDARQLNISQQNSASPNAPASINLQSSVIDGASSTREKLLITGDDVLIEYVHRLMIAV